MDDLGASFDLGSENEDQLARLRRVLTLGAGFQIIIVEVSQPSLAREVLRRLHQWSGKDGVPALTIARTRPGRDPVSPLRQITSGAILVGLDHAFDARGLEHEPAISVDDRRLEAHVEPPAQDPVQYSMTTLNWYRDQLPSLVQGPLVLVLSPDGLRQLFVHAPDLLSWRSHTTRITTPRLVDLEIRPRAGPRASREEKAWLETMIASNARGSFARELPGWLIRLGEIEAHEGGSGDQSFARAEELAAGRPAILCKLEIARARRALDEGRYEDASTHIYRADVHVAAGSSDAESALESTPEPARDLRSRAMDEIRTVLAEHWLLTVDSEFATAMAESLLEGIRDHGDLALVIEALGVAGIAASHNGDRITALARFSEMRTLAGGSRDPAAELFALTRLAELEREIADARRLYLQAMPLTEDADHEARARVCIGLARCELRLGHPEETERVLSQLTAAELKPETRIRILLLRAEAATAQDRHEAALAAYRSAWDEPQRALLPSRSQARIGVLLGEAALRAGDAELARDAYRRVDDIAKVLADSELAAAAGLGLKRAGVET